MGTERSRNSLRWWVLGESTPLLEALRADPDAVLTSPASVARARAGRKRFYRVVSDGAEPALYVKVFELPPGPGRLLTWLRRSKARREVATAAAVAARGFEVAAPLAVGEERRLGLLRRSFLVVPELEGRDLQVVLSDPELPRKRRLKLLLELGAIALRLHGAGVDQDDFSPNNFLVDPRGRLVLLDFERCRVGSPLKKARRWTLLAKLHRHELGVSRTERLRLLRAYLRWGGRPQRRIAWNGIEPAFRKIRRRDARRAARRAFRAGRHVAREGRIWVVRGRESAKTRRLELGRRARRAWVLAHQLERLRLPALRPVRLGRGWLELAEPGPSRSDVDSRILIRRASRRLGCYGKLTEGAEWAFGPEGALLADPTAFRLKF